MMKRIEHGGPVAGMVVVSVHTPYRNLSGSEPSIQIVPNVPRFANLLLQTQICRQVDRVELVRCRLLDGSFLVVHAHRPDDHSLRGPSAFNNVV